MAKSYFTKTFVTFLVVVIASSFNLQGQSCNTELEVHKNRDKRSVTPNNGTAFQLDLTNTQSVAQTYDLSTLIYDSPCDASGPAGNTRGSKSNVLKAVVTREGVRSNSITVAGNTSSRIWVEVEMGSGAKLNSWHCVDVVATSRSCGKDITKKLNVFVSDGKAN